MLAQVFAPIYVSVEDVATRKKYGFQQNKMYLVHAVDVYEDEDDFNKDETLFLMSDEHGKWVWIQMQLTKKVAPPPRRVEGRT